MRILFWTERYRPSIGGIERIVASLAENLVQNGHGAAVVTDRFSAELPRVERINGVAVHRFDLENAIRRRDLPSLHRECQRIVQLKGSFAPDIEHVHPNGSMVMVQQMVARRHRSPTVTSLHIPHDAVAESVAAGGAFAALMRDSSAILTLSDLLRNTLVGALPEVATRVRCERCSLNEPVIAPSSLPFDRPLILCLGRLVHEKGFDLALRALKLIQPEFPGIQMTVAGDGPERKGLEDLRRELGLETAVRFVGWVEPSAVPALIDQSVMVVMPSRWEEAFGLVAVEAAQMGRPVIASAVGATGELVDDGRTGLRCESENPHALAEAMRCLLRDPAYAARLGHEAWNRGTARYDPRRYFQTHLEIYRQFAAAAAPA